MSVLSEDELVTALEKALPEITEDHAANMVAWNPSEWVPWDKGRNFAFLGGEDYDPSEQSLSDTSAAGLLALLLTKDNLPSFHRILAKHFPPFSDWRQLVGAWTAEDNRHSIVLRDYLVVTRATDPVDAENRRRIHVVAGWRQSPEAVAGLGPMDALAMLAVHENQCAHFAAELIKTVDDEELVQILEKVRADDAAQATWFADFLAAGTVADQETTVLAVDRALEAIEHIGSDVADFEAQMELLADFETAASDAAIARTLADALKIESLQSLSDEAQAARDRILERASAS
ncbi:acyl-ACP desaturase [Gordonia zhaorongruii]|uniref:acyl-ACP desaturase n=1 Tax=Gordonia zhaorongruii TaxID=2597659 RepID=UPI001044DEC6|nr:acyl-ACP desaturase [Gordonia zhaorongruii]